MNPAPLRPYTALLVVLLLGAMAWAAPSGKVALRWQPAPDQQIQTEISQKMDLQVTSDAPLPASFPIPLILPMKLAGTIDVSILQKAGKLDDKGLYTLESTVRPTQMAFTMNGMFLPTPSAGDKSSNSFSLTLDRNGRIQGTSSAQSAALASIQDIMVKFMPTGELEAGVPVSTPINMEIPLPIPGVKPFRLVGETSVKLVSVEGEGAARVATVEVKAKGTLNGNIEFGVPGGKEKTSIQLELRLAGGGNLKMNPEKGFVSSMEQDVALDGTFLVSLPGVKEPIPPIRLKGGLRITSSGKPQ